jgi:hypothetical protein
MSELKITDGTETFESWVNRSYIPEELKEKLLQSSILILPAEYLREGQETLFPVSTDKILRFFNNNLPEDLSIDICIADYDYQEFAFYTDYKRLGHFMVKTVALTVFLNLLSNYIYDEYIKADESIPEIRIVDEKTKKPIDEDLSSITEKKYLDSTHVKFTVSVVDTNGTSKNINYEGPANKLDDILKSLDDYEN